MASYEQWVKETVESAKKFNYPWDEKAVDWPDIDHNSVVMEIGCYKGRWSLQMAQRYNPQLYCFEPQPWAAETATRVLKDYNAQVFNFGLGYHNESLPMGNYGTDGCSLVQNLDRSQLVQVKDIFEVVGLLQLEPIDLCMVNIEGFEFVLLPYMLNRGILPEKLVIQFHNYDGRDRESETRRLLTKHGYKAIWDFGTVLSAWQRRW